MKELGQYLKEKREAAKITLEEVSLATKINIRILQAIEEGEEGKLPPKPFVRGFVQAYSKYLGLDVKEVTQRFQEIMGVTAPKTIIIPESNKINKGLPGSIRSILTITAILLTIVAILIIQHVLSKREAEMKPGEVQAITGSDTPLKLPTASASPSASASPGEGEKASPTPAANTPQTKAAADLAGLAKPTATPTEVLSPKATVAPKATVTPAPTAKPTATPKPSPSATATPTPAPSATAAPVAAAAASPTPTPVADEPLVPQEIIVEALDKVTLKITIDNKPAKEVSMSADQILTFKAKGHIKLYTPDGGAISIIQNGFDLGVPGNLGQPKSMVFPK